MEGTVDNQMEYWDGDGADSHNSEGIRALWVLRIPALCCGSPQWRANDGAKAFCSVPLDWD